MEFFVWGNLIGGKEISFSILNINRGNFGCEKNRLV